LNIGWHDRALDGIVIVTLLTIIAALAAKGMKIMPATGDKSFVRKIVHQMLGITTFDRSGVGATKFLRGDGTWATPSVTGSEAFPVGSVYVAVVSTNPNTLLGYGTWSAFGAGRVLVGRDAADVDFDVAEEVGGAKTVASVGTNAAEASHTHSVTSNVTIADHASHTHTYTDVPNHVHVQSVNTGATGAQSGYTADTSTSGTTSTGLSTANPTGGVATGTTAGPGAALTHTPTNNAVTSGAGASHTHTFTGTATSVVQPYIVVYMWKRTA
jgi:hypothetical protein